MESWNGTTPVPQVCPPVTQNPAEEGAEEKVNTDLQERVENACGAATSCSGLDSLDDLNKKIGNHSTCINARNRINNKCFNGGNPGHVQAVEQRVNAINNCKKFISDFGR